MSCSERGQVEREPDAGDVGQRTRKVVDALGLQQDRGHGRRGLQGVGEADGGDEGAQEGGRVVCRVQEGGEDGHFFGKWGGQMEWGTGIGDQDD